MGDIDVVEECGCCRYMRDPVVGSVDQVGSCNFMPPAVCPDPDTGYPTTMLRPTVDLDGWCGQFKRAKESTQ